MSLFEGKGQKMPRGQFNSKNVENITMMFVFIFIVIAITIGVLGGAFMTQQDNGRKRQLEACKILTSNEARMNCITKVGH